jgi:peptide/nickel transport system ATP-binding protein
VPDLLVQDLKIQFDTPQGSLTALEGVSFQLRSGDSFGLVGETGAGKTTLARALVGLHPPKSVSGRVEFDGVDLLALSENEWRSLRWSRIALGVQNAGTAFDPVYTIADQILETIKAHFKCKQIDVNERLHHLAQMCGLEPRHLHSYPHQLSGGEKQRAMLTMALSCQPELLILDEPTGGQDLISRSQLVELIQTLQSEWNFSLILISHDLAAVSQLTRQAGVLYAGQVIETGDSGDLFTRPRHPYTWGLMNSYPNMTTSRDLVGIRGQLPNPLDLPSGCRFHPRCTQAVEICHTEMPSLQPCGERKVACHLGGLQPLITVEGLSQSFPVQGNHRLLRVLKDVSLTIYEGEVVAIIGQTGSGKTTLARSLVGLLKREAGRIWLEGHEILPGSRNSGQQRLQYIPQDPFDAVSPRLSVQEIVREPLDILNTRPLAERNQIVQQALRAVNLPDDDSLLHRYSHQLSGGQLQRVCVARALTVNPKLIIADEPVSMLDPSEQARLIRRLKELQNERGMGLLLISHDLSLVRKVADRILVLHEGEIIEEGPSGWLVSQPQNPFTQKLVNAAPRIAVRN